MKGIENAAKPARKIFLVGVATIALGLALVIRINEAYGTIEEDEIFAEGEPE